MFFYQGMTCPVCGKEFTQKDDIVSCPQCGAPHHRACWKAEGHCHFADRHGTPEQWSREKASAASPSEPAADGMRRCPHCGALNPEFAEFCAHCARPLETEDWSQAVPPRPEAPPPPAQDGENGTPYREYTPFFVPPVDPLGGIPKTEQIGSESVADVAAAVGQNTAYYIPRFFHFSHGGSRISWNWAAFLLTPYWLLYRKNYLSGGLMLLFRMSSMLLTNLLYASLYGSFNGTTAALIQYTQQLMADPASRPYLYLIAGLSLVDFLLRFVFGLFGTYSYMGATLNRIGRLRLKSPENFRTLLPTVGGVSFLLGMLAYFLLQMTALLSQMF